MSLPLQPATHMPATCRNLFANRPRAENGLRKATATLPRTKKHLARPAREPGGIRAVLLPTPKSLGLSVGTKPRLPKTHNQKHTKHTTFSKPVVFSKQAMAMSSVLIGTTAAYVDTRTAVLACRFDVARPIEAAIPFCVVKTCTSYALRSSYRRCGPQTAAHVHQSEYSVETSIVVFTTALGSLGALESVCFARITWKSAQYTLCQFVNVPEPHCVRGLPAC